jgi:chromosome segregation ATPase
MKLSDFSKQPAKRKSAPKFILKNDFKEQSYKEQITSLESKISFLENIQLERDSAIREAAVAKSHLEDERVQFQEFKEEIARQQTLILEQEKRLEQLPNVEEELRNQKGANSSLKNQVNSLEDQLIKKSQDFQTSSLKLESITSERDSLLKTTSEASSIKISTEVELEQVRNKNKELESFANEKSKINKGLSEKNKTLGDMITTKEFENNELLVQVDELKSIETKLRGWIGDMEVKDTNITSSKNSLENQVVKQKELIKDMSHTLEDIMKELSYARQVNKAYREELSKPTYTSMASIASQEGFVMPNGKENIRSHNLGNYKPTLLKFKKKEETKNGR